jgi:hypothetical protein
MHQKIENSWSQQDRASDSTEAAARVAAELLRASECISIIGMIRSIPEFGDDYKHPQLTCRWICANGVKFPPHAKFQEVLYTSTLAPPLFSFFLKEN